MTALIIAAAAIACAVMFAIGRHCGRCYGYNEGWCDKAIQDGRDKAARERARRNRSGQFTARRNPPSLTPNARNQP